MRNVLRISKNGKVKKVGWSSFEGLELSSRVDLIQALIPVGLRFVEEMLRAEVEELAGKRYKRVGRKKGCVRWTSQRGSVYLGDQKVPVNVPRVRNRILSKEERLKSYEMLQEPRNGDESLFRKVLLGLSCRDYESCAQALPGVFGLSSSTVSRRFIRISSRKLNGFFERSLSGYDIVSIFLDGKSFALDEIVIALGVTTKGEKIILGFIQTGTENERVIKEFLSTLVDRGLKYKDGLLFVIDGSKGIRSAIERVFSDYALVQRCQWHKRENVVSYLPKGYQSGIRKKLQEAYEKKDYNEARGALLEVKKELSRINVSAVKSLEEGFEETLTLHKLGLFKELGISFKTTNCLESLMASIGRITDKVSRWRDSSHKQRWVACALLEIEPRLRKVKGYKHLPKLRAVLKEIVGGETKEKEQLAA